MKDDYVSTENKDAVWKPTMFLRWREYEWYDYKEERHLDMVLEQKWINSKTGTDVWNPIDKILL